MERVGEAYRRLRRPGSVSQRLMAAVGWSSVLQLVSRAQGAVLLAVTARLLSPQELGTFFAIQAIGILGASLWDLGSTVLITRDIAAGTARGPAMIRAALRQRLVTAPAFVLVVGLLCSALSSPGGFSAVTVLLILAAPGVVGIGTIYNSVLMGRQEFAASAFSVTTGRVVSVVLMLAVLPIGVRGAEATACLAVALLIGEVITFILQRRSSVRGRHKSGTDSAVIKPGSEEMALGRFIRKSVPHAANSVFNYAYQKGDILIVTALAGVVATAQYTPASQLQNVLSLFPTLLAAGIIPVISSDQHSGRILAAAVGRRIAQIAATISIPVCIISSMFMDAIITAVIGRSDDAYVLPAIIVIWALPFLCIHTPLTQALIARGLAAQATTAYAIAFTGSLALHIALVPTYGAVGAAIASGTRDVVMLAAILAIAHWSRTFSRSSDDA